MYRFALLCLLGLAVALPNPDQLHTNAVSAPESSENHPENLDGTALSAPPAHDAVSAVDAPSEQNAPPAQDALSAVDAPSEQDALPVQDAASAVDAPSEQDAPPVQDAAPALLAPSPVVDHEEPKPAESENVELPNNEAHPVEAKEEPKPEENKQPELVSQPVLIQTIHRDPFLTSLFNYLPSWFKWPFSGPKLIKSHNGVLEPELEKSNRQVIVIASSDFY